MATSFDKFNLKPGLLGGIADLGLTTPSEIQTQAIPLLLQGRNLIAQGLTGSGMTAAFSIGVLQSIDTSVRTPQAIILSPTHESATLANKAVQMLGKRIGAECCVSIGGTDVSTNIHELKKGVHVAVGTLGRIYHMMIEKHLSVGAIRMVVIDEADLILEPKFRKKLRKIMKYIRMRNKNQVQVTMFSATYSKNILKLARGMVKNAAEISVPPLKLYPKSIDQYYLPLQKDENRTKVLRELFAKIPQSITQIMIFCKGAADMSEISSEMPPSKHFIEYFSPDLPSSERERIMDAFLSGNLRTVVNTGSLSRGLDLKRIKVVINYRKPSNAEYLHCVGRCGRNGTRGVAITIIDTTDVTALHNLEKKHGLSITVLPQDLKWP